jgi:hypothetical protein
MAIGVLNHPSLDWQFVSGDLHTVPVGFGPGGDPQVVMDILLFERMSAEESIAHAMKKLDAAEEGDGLESYYEAFVRGTVPLLRASARPGDRCRVDRLAQVAASRGQRPRPLFVATGAQVGQQTDDEE